MAGVTGGAVSVFASGALGVFITLLFWLTLLLPGYAIVRRIWPDDLAGGLLGVVGLSYLAVCGLLSPVAILGYCLHLPLAVFSGACMAAILGAAVYITWRRWWRELGRLVLSGLGLSLGLIALDLVLGGRVGAYLSGDSRVHVARIRYLLDYGLSNQDPYLDIPAFFTIYHTNLIHALHAAACQLTSTDYLSTWFVSLVWAKLVIAGGGYYLGWCVFERRWAAWATAIFLVAMKGPVTFVVYPNQLAMYWLMPVVLGCAVQTVTNPSRRCGPLKLALAGLVLGQVHGLYALFAGLLVAPTLLAVLVQRLRLRRPGRATALASLLALGCGAPFLLASALADRHLPRPPAPAEPDAQFNYGEDGRLALKPGEFMGERTAISCVLLGGGALAGLCSDRRRQVGAMLSAAGVAAALLFIPQLCTPMVHVLGEPWILARLGGAFGLVLAVLAAGTLAWYAERVIHRRWLQALISVGIAAGGVAYPRYTDTSWAEYFAQARKPRAERHEDLEGLNSLRVEFADYIEPGSVVLADANSGRRLVMLCNCRIVAPDRGSRAAEGMPERQQDLQVLLHTQQLMDGQPAPRQREILLAAQALIRKYNIRYFLITRKIAEDSTWARYFASDWRKSDAFILVKFRAD